MPSIPVLVHGQLFAIEPLMYPIPFLNSFDDYSERMYW